MFTVTKKEVTDDEILKGEIECIKIINIIICSLP